MIYKLITSFVCVGMMLTILSNENVNAESVTIETDNLLIRSGAGSSYEPLTHADQGDTYSFINQQDKWIEIELADQTGWVHEDFVSVTDSPSPSESTDLTNGEIPESFSIPIESVTLRKEPTPQSERLDELSQHHRVSIIEVVDEWIKVKTSDNQEGYIPNWILSIESTNQSLNEQTFVIDPGHGGEDIGATGISGQYESEYALFTSYILQRQLELLGAEVHLTRSDDYYHALGPRPALSNYKHADAFISIHYNSEPNYPSANGMDTLYRNTIDEQLALSIHDQLIKTTDANDRGVVTGNYQILRLSKRPSMLLELGFLSNQAEEQRIQSIPYQYLISEGIIKGIIES